MSISKCSPTTPKQHAVSVWAFPVSLATTQGITIVFFSSRYLDVSVHGVGSLLLVQYIFNVLGCPIRKPSDITLVCSSPKLIAAYHVLHRLSDPRHPPYALNCFKNLKIISNISGCPYYLLLNKCNLLVITTFYSQYVKELYLSLIKYKVYPISQLYC